MSCAGWAGTLLLGGSRRPCLASCGLSGQRLLAATWLARHTKSSRCRRWEEDGVEERSGPRSKPIRPYNPQSHAELAPSADCPCAQAWRDLAPLLRRKRGILAAAAARLRHRSLSAAWASWRLFVTARRAQRDRALAVVQRMQHVRLACALATWREAAAEAASKWLLTHRAAEYFTGSTLRRCFDTWRANMAEDRAEEAAQRQHTRMLLLRAYTGWEAAAQQRRALRHKGQAVVRRMQNR